MDTSSLSSVAPYFQRLNSSTIQRILYECSPFDLSTLLQVNRQLHNIITAPTSTFFQQARQRLLDMPAFASYQHYNPFFGTWNEGSYANFAFGEANCSLCGDLTYEESLLGASHVCLPMFRTRLHTPECHQLFLSQLVTVPEYKRRIHRRCPQDAERINSHRVHYLYRIPSQLDLDGQPEKFLQSHIQALDEQLFQAGLEHADMRGDPSLLLPSEIERIADVMSSREVAQNFALWHNHYDRKRMEYMAENLNLVQKYARQRPCMKFEVVSNTLTVRLLIRSFSRDHERVTPAVWKHHLPTIIPQYKQMRNQPAKAPATAKQASRSSSSNDTQRKSMDDTKRSKKAKASRSLRGIQVAPERWE